MHGDVCISIWRANAPVQWTLKMARQYRQRKESQPNIRLVYFDSKASWNEFLKIANELIGKFRIEFKLKLTSYWLEYIKDLDRNFHTKSSWIKVKQCSIQLCLQWAHAIYNKNIIGTLKYISRLLVTKNQIVLNFYLQIDTKFMKFRLKSMSFRWIKLTWIVDLREAAENSCNLSLAA